MSAFAPVVLVTGAARRIGAAIVRRLHADGYAVALHCNHSRGAADALAAELDAQRAGSVHVLQGDLADAAVLPTLVEDTVAHFGRLDALVNNAATFTPTAFDSTGADAFDALMATNARAPFLLAQAAAPHLRAARGAIVNIGDLYAERPRADLVAYAASKAALLGLTRGLAVALAPEVRVNAVSPGAILWPEDGEDAAQQARILDATPLARLGSAEEIADAVAWLLRGGFTTGEVLRLDGGRSL
ncbi:pteridine reductase [Luteimonas fraxinea]|uniref:Pteridine reductase n=1 Tax=Luteimonas fraxinea TaxID=2901869 RepID=A0ABS8UCM9_9GAMM|nr:pteridine reductase [Luteimonas fraxinea]MCD9097228.1 pteridine reductase [Luteimonas fraxinea]MCD9125207.1 pteridine reductase [Luteimonas fraxinea]UHH11494.1 pteridine reductase [Luteimonas fraxinea]